MSEGKTGFDMVTLNEAKNAVLAQAGDSMKMTLDDTMQKIRELGESKIAALLCRCGAGF